MEIKRGRREATIFGIVASLMFLLTAMLSYPAEQAGIATSDPGYAVSYRQ